MTRLLSITIAALIFGTPAIAQTIIVRSGEHEGFTRLVLKIPENVAWSIDTSGRSLFLKTNLPSINFDVSHVFDRIPRDRIVALSQDGPGLDLVLSLGCECSTSSFMDSTGLLAIDIKDMNSKPIYRRQPLGFPLNQTTYRFTNKEGPAYVAPAGLQGLLLPVVTGPAPSTAPAAKPVQIKRPPTRRPGAVSFSEERLLKQIDRASEQGLLELTVTPTINDVSAVGAEAAEPTGATEQPETQAPPLPISISVTTAVDRDLVSVAQMAGLSAKASTCLSSDRIALHEWGGDRSFSEEISHWRAQLFGEFDRLNPNIALKLARAYLHFGFGAEAARVIGLRSQPSADTHILRAISQILETDAITSPNPFSGQQKCPGDVALWAVLSTAMIAEDFNRNATKLAFSRLPTHVRSYLGPRISQKFAQAGDSQMADFILRTMTRTTVEPGLGLELAKAAVAELRGDTDTMERELANSLVSDAMHAPEALIRLVAKSIETRSPVSPDLPELSAAYALEFRNAPIGADLRRTHAIALVLANQFLEAFERLPEIEEKDGYANRLLVLPPLLSLLSERSDDVTFLQIALNFKPESIRKIPAETGSIVAQRLLGLGLPVQAEHWISAPTEGPSLKGQRLLRAEIALANRLPHRTKVELLGLDGPRADRLRAAAMMQHGDFKLAGQILAATGDFDNAARGFWLAEEWETIPEQTGAHYTQVVVISRQLRSETGIVTQLPPLARARVLMQDSTSARAHIMQLLQSVSLDSHSPP